MDTTKDTSSYAQTQDWDKFTGCVSNRCNRASSCPGVTESTNCFNKINGSYLFSQKDFSQCLQSSCASVWKGTNAHSYSPTINTCDYANNCEKVSYNKTLKITDWNNFNECMERDCGYPSNCLTEADSRKCYNNTTNYLGRPDWDAWTTCAALGCGGTDEPQVQNTKLTPMSGTEYKPVKWECSHPFQPDAHLTAGCTQMTQYYCVQFGINNANLLGYSSTMDCNAYYNCINERCYNFQANWDA